MSAPLCKLCRTSHWNSEPHVFPETLVTKPVPNIPNAVPNGEIPRTAAERSAEWKKANRERYNERQRDLMKARRAKA